MRFIYSTICHITSMVYLIAVIFHILYTSSNSLPIEIETPDTLACFKSLSDPEVYFPIAVGFPSPPKYLLADIEYYLYPEDQKLDPIEDWITHHLVYVGKECPTKIKFSNGGIKFKSWKIIINTYLGYYRQAPFLDFLYEFKSEFKYDIDRFIDIHNRVHLFVEMQPGKKPYQTSEYVPVENVMKAVAKEKVEAGYICVTAEQNHFVIKPSYIGSKTLSSHIAGVVARVYQNGKSEVDIPWAAYGCVAPHSDVPGDLYFILSKFDKNTKLYFTLRYIDTENEKWKIDINKLNDGVHFVTSDIKPVQFEDLGKLPTWASKSYIMELSKGYESCTDGTERFVYTTPKGTIVYGSKQETKELVKGAKQSVWVYISDPKKCKINQ